jgi:hypothetical protein
MIADDVVRLQHKIARLSKEAQEYAYLAQQRRKQITYLRQEVLRLEREDAQTAQNDPR